MKLENLVEQPDGSAMVTLDLSAEETRLLIEAGFTKLLSEFLVKEEKQRDLPALLRPHGGL